MPIGNPDEEPTWLTIALGARRGGVHVNTIRNLIASGKLPAYRIGSRIVRIKQTDLDALFTRYTGGEFGVWK
jgi:excisionase family DNA binding protein